MWAKMSTQVFLAVLLQLRCNKVVACRTLCWWLLRTLTVRLLLFFFDRIASPVSIFFNRTENTSTVGSLLHPILGGSRTNINHSFVVSSIFHGSEAWGGNLWILRPLVANRSSWGDASWLFHFLSGSVLIPNAMVSNNCSVGMSSNCFLSIFSVFIFVILYCDDQRKQKALLLLLLVAW